MLISSDRILELIFVSTNKNPNPKLDIIILKKFGKLISIFSSFINRYSDVNLFTLTYYFNLSTVINKI